MMMIMMRMIMFILMTTAAEKSTATKQPQRRATPQIQPCQRESKEIICFTFLFFLLNFFKNKMDINIYFCCYPHTLRSSVLPYMVKKENNKEKKLWYDSFRSIIHLQALSQMLDTLALSSPFPRRDSRFSAIFCCCHKKAVALWHYSTTAIRPWPPTDQRKENYCINC